jgi:hypothetical protein
MAACGSAQRKALTLFGCILGILQSCDAPRHNLHAPTVLALMPGNDAMGITTAKMVQMNRTVKLV